jgi:hypothetical protein
VLGESPTCLGLVVWQYFEYLRACLFCFVFFVLVVVILFFFLCVHFIFEKFSKRQKYFNLVIFISSFFCLMHLECPLCAHVSHGSYSLCLKMFSIYMSCHIISMDNICGYLKPKLNLYVLLML